MGRHPDDALSARQHELLLFIGRHLSEQGYPPTLREMAAHLGCSSTNAINDFLVRLERKDYIHRPSKTGQSRALTLTTKALELLHLPGPRSRRTTTRPIFSAELAVEALELSA
jgi:repressor LexA